MNKKHLSSGRTTLELLAVIAILGVIAVGVYGMAANVLSKQRTMETVNHIHKLVDAIQDAYSWTDSSGNPVNKQYLIDEGILSNNDFRLPSGQEITISGASNNFKVHFSITAKDKAICRAIAMENWGDRLVELSIKNNRYKKSQLPLSLITATSNCTLTSNSSSYIYFIFR